MRRAPSPTASVMSDAIGPLPGHSSSAEEPTPIGPAAKGKPPVAARTPVASQGNMNSRGTRQQLGLSTSPGRSQHRFKLSSVGHPVGPRRLLIEPCYQCRPFGGRQEGSSYGIVLSLESNFWLFRLLGRRLGGLLLYDLRRDKRRSFFLFFLGSGVAPDFPTYTKRGGRAHLSGSRNWYAFEVRITCQTEPQAPNRSCSR